MLTNLSYEEQFREIACSKDKLESFTGQAIHWFRPAYGVYNEDTMAVMQRLQLKMVLWQIASWDWMHQEDPEKIADNVWKHVGPGDIVLLHELPQTVKILPALIHGIREKGLELARPYTSLRLDHSKIHV